MKPHVQTLQNTAFSLQLMDIIGTAQRRCRNLPILRTAIVGGDPQILDITEALTDSGFAIQGFFAGDPADIFHPSRPLSEFRAANFDIVLFAPASNAEANRITPDFSEYYLNRPHPDCTLVLVPGICDGFRSALENLSSLLTCLNLRKLCVIASLLSQTSGGAVVECGAFMGGTTVLLGSLLRQWGDPRPVLTFDTFEGMPAPVAKDGETVYVAGLFTETSYEHISRLITQNALTDRIAVHKGLVQDNLPRAFQAHNTISFALVDTDQYLGTIESLKQIVPRLATSGIIIIDDYGVSGVRLAVDEAKTLFPSLKGALMSENFYALWDRVDDHFLSNTVP
jgi:predicted O-methyltransferase YrrM